MTAKVIAPVVLGLLMLGLWEGAVRAAGIPPYILPGPILVAETLVADWSREGVIMHAETLAAQAAKRARHLAILLVPVWLVTAALVAIALALVFGR